MQTAPVPSSKELRSFALVNGSLFALIFGLVLPWLWNWKWPIWPWAVGGALIAWGVIHPASVRLLYASWMKLAAVLGRVNNGLILGFIFFLVILPFGWARRLGGDALRRSYDSEALSYREPKRARAAETMERPF